MLLTAAKRRAKRAGIPFALTIKDITIPDKCPVLGIPIFSNDGIRGATDNSPSLDRIIPNLGYVPGNVRVISYRANAIKRDASLFELEAVVRYVRDAVANNDDQEGA